MSQSFDVPDVNINCYHNAPTLISYSEIIYSIIAQKEKRHVVHKIIYNKRHVVHKIIYNKRHVVHKIIVPGNAQNKSGYYIKVGII